MKRLYLGMALFMLAAAAAAEEKPRRVLPGLKRDGTVQLPNLWKLDPVGTPTEVGDFPVNIAIHPGGAFAAVLHAGLREHEVVVLRLSATPAPSIVSRLTIPQTFYGLCFSPDGKHVYASGGEYAVVHRIPFDGGVLGKPEPIKLPGDLEGVIVGGVAASPKGDELYAAATWGDRVFRLPLGEGEPAVIKLPAKKDSNLESAPLAVLPSADGKRVYVSLWSRAAVACIDLKSNQIAAEWPTASHPTELALTPDGKTLYVACANSTKVSVLDVTNGKALQTINCALSPRAPAGNTPNSLTLTGDGQLMFVANADANNLSVFNTSDRKKAVPLGFVPTGWYPTSVRHNPKDKRLYIANGKGLLPKPNRSGPVPNLRTARGLTEYIGLLYKGYVTTLPVPTPEKMAGYTRRAYKCSPLTPRGRPTDWSKVADDNPIPKKIGGKSPIEYVIYVVKENRTYDQVFGDVKEGNGEPEICLFPERVTPNHHKIAREFVLLDNFYVEGEVSADGHEWSMGAYATDFVEKVWPLVYRGSAKGKLTYPSEGNFDKLARPAGGYLWDRCQEAGVSYRSYGEFVNNGKTPNDPCTAAVPALKGHFDPMFRSYDLDYTDVKRAGRFIGELKRFEKAGDMPRLQIVRLPNDHTYGTAPGKPTPTAMVADNDLALGMLVDAVSRSKFWKKTAIFVVEDDAQNGPDHVDAHRAVALVVSPYTKRNYVDSSMYSTSSMLRTMELILGLKPMSQFDAAARPMFNSFTAKADSTPYKHVVPQVDRGATNLASAFGAEWSRTAALAEKEDAVDDLVFNEVIWKAVRGRDSPCPPPVRAAFFLPELEDDEDD